MVCTRLSLTPAAASELSKATCGWEPRWKVRNSVTPDHRTAQRHASTASTQLKLQHAVEGLSVVAISYYAISLLLHLLRGAEDLGLHLNMPLLEVTLVPAVLVMAFLMIRGVRKGIASGRC